MADQGDQTPRSGSNEQASEQEPVTPSPPGIVITPAEGSANDEEVKSSNDLLQVSHDTEDDGALPKVRSEPTADIETESEEKPLASPEDDEFEASGEVLERPVSPIDDEEEDEQSVTSSRFSESDSDEEETRGRARRSSRDRDMSPSRTLTTRFASQEHIEKETSERRRSKEGLAKGERRHPTKSKSPLAIKSITRDGEAVIVTSPTHGTITITDPKVVEELADGQLTLPPVNEALDISQDAQDAIERAFEKQEILKIAESYKNGPKHIPPPVSARPDSPQFGMSAGDAEATLQSNNPSSQHTKLPGVSAPAETGTLHRRTASKELSGQFLMQKRYDMIHGDMRKLAVNPSHRIGGWTKDDLWSFIRAQENKILSIAEVLHKNNLQSDIEGMITLQDERRFARNEIERIKSEFELQTIANEQRVAELETELVNAEAENERLLAMQTMDQSREAILTSPVKLSPEANEALAKVEKHVEHINTKHEEVCKGMDQLRSQLDLTQQLQADNNELRHNMELLENQVDFYDHQNEKLRHRMDEQELENDRITKAYKVLQKENAQLKTRVQNLQDARNHTEVENAELKTQLDLCQNAKSELEEDKLVAAQPRVEPVDSFFSTKGVGSEEESKSLRDSNLLLSGKVSTLERLLTSTREESVKFKELYNAAEEQRVWSLAHYATVREPWPIATRETIAQLIVTVVNDNRKPVEESSKPADAALNGRPARDLQFELTGLVEDAPLPGLLTKDQVVSWFAAGMGLPKIFEEIRTVGLHLDKETEQEILRVLIEQGLCYGNYDVFSTFVFADKPFSRKEFIAGQTDMITVMDELEVRMLKTETDLKLAQDKVTELEHTDREQAIKLEEQDHDLKQARQALETFENYHGDPEGALEELIELRTAHANLREELKEVEDANEELQDQVAYYEKEIVKARSESESLGFAGVSSTDQGTCNVSAHQDLEARTHDLEKQNQELVAYSRDQEVAAAQMPDSPACPNCYNMRRTIEDLHKKLREQKRQAVEARENAGSPISPPGSSPSSAAEASAASYCDNCAYTSKQLGDAKFQNKALEEKLRFRKNEVRGCNYETDEARRDLDEANEQLQKTQTDLADAQKEILRLRSEESSSSATSTSTAPTSTGESSARESEKDDRIKELEALLEKSQQSLSDKINDRLTGHWGAQKLAAPPADQEDDMWDSFDIEGNASKLAAEKTQLEEQVTALQKNLNMFEAAAKIWEDEANVTASQIENAESVALHARIENLQRQVEVIPGLEEKISTLVEEKKNLIDTIEYLGGDKRPECCLATRTELQKEIDAHVATRNELEEAVDAAATSMNNGTSEEVKQELKKVQQELPEATRAHALYVTTENSRYADLMVTKSDGDPCKDVRDELEALKIEHADMEDALRTASVENENTKRLLKQARIQGSRIKTTGDANVEDPCKDIRDEFETTKTRLTELQTLLDGEKTKKPANPSTHQHGDLVQQIRELEEQITKTRGAHNAQARIEKLVQRVRDDAVKIAELQFEIGKLEAISKVYVLAGDRHGPPENDHECKDTIMELIAAQTKFKGLVDDYRLDAPAKKAEPVDGKKSEPVKEKKEEPKSFIRDVFGIFKKFTLQLDPTAESAVSSPVEAPKAEEPQATELEAGSENDPCSMYKKQLKDVQKQVDAFEMLTLFKEKFLREQEIVERKDKENMHLKNKLEIILNDAPISLRKRLTEALEANRRQANIIGCNEIVAAQHHKEMTALRKKLEILLKPDQVMKDLMTKNLELEKTLDKVQGKFFKANLENGKKLNFLGRQLSELYAARDDWRDSKTQLSKGLWKPAEEVKSSKTVESSEGADAKTSESASKTPESASKKIESALNTANYETGEDFRGTAEHPWPKITYDCWPQPPPRLQKTFDDMYDANEKLYNNPVYVLKDRVPNHPKPDITGLWNEVQNTRWKLTEPKKQPWYRTASKKFNQYTENEYFLPAVWAVILILEHLGYNHYILPTLDFIFGHERGPHSFMIRWASLIFLFFLIYTFWLWHQLRGIFGKRNGGDDGDDDSSDQPPKDDPCKDVKKELADTKAELDKAKGSSDKGNSKKEDSKKDDSDPCRDIRTELATTTAKLNDAQAQLNGEKSVIDWKNDKRSNSQWQQLKNTKFWKVAGIPGPRSSNAVTFEEFQRNGGAGVSSEPSVQFASQIGSRSRSAPPPYGFKPTVEDFDLAAYLPDYEHQSEFEYPTPEVDAWVDSDDVPATEELGSKSAATGINDAAATDYASPFDFTTFFVPAEADLSGLGAAAGLFGLGADTDFTVSKMRDGAISGSESTASADVPKSDSSIQKTPSEWIADLNAEMAKDPTLKQPAQLPFTYPSTDSTPMSYVDFVQNRLAAPQSANNNPIWLSPFRGGDGTFDPKAPPTREARRYHDEFIQRRQAGQVCCKVDYDEQIARMLLNPDPSALGTPKVCTHRPLGRHGADDFGSPYARPRRLATNPSHNTVAAPYAPDQSTLASAWRNYLRKHPHLRRFVAGRYPWKLSPAKPGSVNLRENSRQRRIMAKAYGVKFPSHGDLTAWHAAHALLPPSDRDLKDVDEQHKGFKQIPEELRGMSGAAAAVPNGSALGGPEAKAKASGIFSQIPDHLRTPEVIAAFAASADGVCGTQPPAAFSQIPDHLRNFRVGAARVPVFNTSGRWPDPCKDVKERLAKAQRELDLLMSRDECAEVRKRVKELYEELQAKTVLYDPVREQLTRVEAELAEEKKEEEHEAAKQKVALADPKTIKTNEQQKADAKAQQAALEEAEQKITAAQAQADQSRRRADEFRRALEFEKSRRLIAPSVEAENVVPSSDDMTWRRFLITLALSVLGAFYIFPYTTLGQMPMYQDSALSVSEILWYDTIESTRGYHGLIITLGGIILVMLLIWAATLASADRGVNPYPDFDGDGNNGGDDKKDHFDNKSDGKKGTSPKRQLSFFLPPSPLSPTFKPSPRGSNSTSTKSPRGFQTTRQQTWKHSYISSVSTEPTAGTSAGAKTVDISPYCKELEDRVERLERELLAARTKVSAFTQSAISSIDLRPQAGPRADQKRQDLAHSAISSIGSAPQAANEVAKNVEQKVESTASESIGLWNKITGLLTQTTFTTAPSSPEKTTDGSTEDKDLRAELDNVKKELEDARKEIAANKKQPEAKVEAWDTVETSNDDWLDPCKHVNEELERVKQQFKEARVESRWLRKQKEKAERKRDGADVDGEDEGNDGDDDDYPPPGSLEMKFIIAEDLVKMREQQLEQAARDLEVCHEANVALRKRFYDERDGWEAERKRVEELKQAAASRQTLSTSAQTSPVKIETTPSGKPDTQASSGGIDHTECHKRMNDLMTQRDQLRDDRAESDMKCRDAESQARQLRDEIAVLNTKVQGLERGLGDAVKENDHYKGMYNRGADHGMCLRGGKRNILEKRIADFEKDGDQRVAEHEETIKNLKNMMQGLKKDADKRQNIAESRKLEAQQLRNQLSDEQIRSRGLMTRPKDAVAKEKKAVEDLETVRTQLSECEEARNQVNEDQFAQERLDIAIREAKDAKDQLDRWVNQIELNKTRVPENVSSEPEVARLQRFLFERTTYIELLIYQKKRVEENLEWYRNRLERAFEAEDHEQCQAMERLYKQQAEMAEDARKEAADKNRQMWYDVLDERTKTYHANEEKEAAEKRVEDLKKEKEALAKQLEDKIKVCPPEIADDDKDSASSEVAPKALRDARLATRLAEAESRKLKLERDRLARENALLTQRLERKIDTLEHSSESKIRGALPPTPISTDPANKTKKQRPADIITSFENLEDPFYDGLVTGGITSRLPKFNPNRLLDILGHPRSLYTPRRAPIPTPEPPYTPFEPLTPEGRRRSAERMISDPEREKALAEERAYLAAVRAVEFEFEEQRSDEYALFYTLLRGRLNIPVRDVMARLERVVEEEEDEEKREKITENENMENEKKDAGEDEGEESSDSSLDDEEFNKRYNMTPTPLPRNRRTPKGVYHSP
ncbi:hypothetical protein KCU95_g1340, partial [Aureobasidium melanogenum]